MTSTTAPTVQSVDAEPDDTESWHRGLPSPDQADPAEPDEAHIVLSTN